MMLKTWVLAAMALVLLGLGALIGRHYVPGFNSDIQVEFKENSCAIRCPADSAHASEQGSVTCTAGSAPLCQCTNLQQPTALCVTAH
jgi:hypothetical protein